MMLSIISLVLTNLISLYLLTTFISWLDISIQKKMITGVNLVTTCHHAKMLHYWLFSSYYTFHSLDLFTLWWEFFTSSFSHTLFYSSPTPCPSDKPLVCTLYQWLSSVLFVGLVFCFVLFFHTSHISEFIQYLPFSIWLTSLSEILSRFIPVVTDGKISFFYGWLIFNFVCVCHIFYIHILMGTWVASVSWLLWIMLQWIQGCIYLFLKVF